MQAKSENTVWWLGWLGVTGEQLPSAYTLIDRMRFGAKQLFNREHLTDLWILLYGYRFGMILHHVPSNINDFSFEHFQDWLEDRVGADAGSWHKALLAKAASEEAAFQEFFRLLDEYRSLFA